MKQELEKLINQSYNEKHNTYNYKTKIQLNGRSNNLMNMIILKQYVE